MNIQRLSGFEELDKIKGIVIVIDVFRAFSCEAVLFELGVEKIILCADPEEAFALKNESDMFLIGENLGEQQEKFDFGNSPSRLLAAQKGSFLGKTIIHRTSNGTKGTVSALQRAEHVFVTGFLTARATITAVQQVMQETGIQDVTIVAMGSLGLQDAEDEMCAICLAKLLLGENYDHIHGVNEILDDARVQEWRKGEISWIPSEDVIYALQYSVYDFAMQAQLQEDGHAVVTPYV